MARRVLTPGLWPHQVEAVAAVTRGIGRGGRATLVAACGTGKTRIGEAVTAELGVARRVLVVVPTIELLLQTLQVYQDSQDGVAAVVAVCSDPTIGELAALAGQPDVVVTTEAGVVAGTTRGLRRVTVLSTYASLPVFAAAHQDHGLPSWDLIVIDEAHRTTGKADGPWKAVHHDRLLPAHRRLYMTATPRIATGSGDATVSMDDKAIYGDVAYRLPFSRAIEMGLLADYRVVVPVVTDADVHQLARDASLTMRLAGADVTPEVLAGQIAVLRCMSEYGIRRAISYHHRIAAASRWARSLPAAARLLPGQFPNLWAGHVSGHMAPTLRRRIIDRLADPGEQLVVVSNARVLNEGIDVPAVEGIVFERARESAIDTVQAVGRALRTGGRTDKTATIVVPLLLSEGESPEAALEGSEWAPVWQVIRALRDHDDRLEEQLRVMRQSLGEFGVDGPTSRTVSMPGWLHIRGIDVPEDFAAAISIKAVRATTVSWDEYFGAARSYFHLHGHANMGSDWVSPGGLRVGSWIVDQRKAHKAGRLDHARHDALDALNLIWDIPEHLWATGLGHATGYHAEHGNLRVRLDHLTADGYQLGRWLSWQRMARKTERLSADRIAALDALGMNWNLALTAWQQGFAHAAEYRRVQGDLLVPHGWATAEGYRLGLWIGNQRRDFQNGKLTPEQITALDEIAMVWTPIQDAWNSAFEHACAYRERQGHLDVPSDFTSPDGFRLGNWIASQRRAFKDAFLPAERITALEDLGLCWDVLEAKWNRGYAAAVHYRDQFKDLRVHLEFVTDSGFKLGAWISHQRKAYTNGTLAADRVARLAALGMSWRQPDDTWKQAYGELAAYRDAEGHMDLPKDYLSATGINLYAWMGTQRTMRTTGRMPEARVAMLDEIGFPWDTAREKWMRRYQQVAAMIGDPAQPRYLPQGSAERIWLDNQRIAARKNKLDADRMHLLDALGEQPDQLDMLWMNIYEELAAYQADNGHLRIPSGYRTLDGTALSAWATTQRQRRRQGKLSDERIRLLDKLDFAWEPRK